MIQLSKQRDIPARLYEYNVQRSLVISALWFVFVLPDLQLLNGKNGKAAIRGPDHKLFAECFVVYNIVILICLIFFANIVP